MNLRNVAPHGLWSRASSVFAALFFGRLMMAIPACCGSWPYATLSILILLALICSAVAFRMAQALLLAASVEGISEPSRPTSEDGLMYRALGFSRRTDCRVTERPLRFPCVAMLGLVIAAIGAEAIEAYALHPASPVNALVGHVLAAVWITGSGWLVWRSRRGRRQRP